MKKRRGLPPSALPLLGSNQDSPDPEGPPQLAKFQQLGHKMRVRVTRCWSPATASSKYSWLINPSSVGARLTEAAARCIGVRCVDRCSDLANTGANLEADRFAAK